MNVRNEIKAQIIRAGMTMQEVVTRYAHGSVPKFVVDPNLAVIPTGFTHIKDTATRGVAQLIEEIKKL